MNPRDARLLINAWRVMVFFTTGVLAVMTLALGTMSVTVGGVNCGSAFAARPAPDLSNVDAGTLIDLPSAHDCAVERGTTRNWVYTLGFSTVAGVAFLMWMTAKLHPRAPMPPTMTAGGIRQPSG